MVRVYRIQHPTQALVYCNASSGDGGFWSSDDAFVVEFGDTDEEYADAVELAKSVNGEVVEIAR